MLPAYKREAPSSVEQVCNGCYKELSVLLDSTEDNTIKQYREVVLKEIKALRAEKVKEALREKEREWEKARNSTTSQHFAPLID
jgi:hypothetical protein